MKEKRKNDMEEIQLLLNKKECHCITKKEFNRLYYLKDRENSIIRAKNWLLNNPEKAKINKKKYKRRHIFVEMSRSANGRFDDKITKWDLWKIAKKQKLKCGITGDHLTKENISLDHVIPRSKGGKNIVENLRLTTMDANWIKDAYDDEEFFNICKRVYFNMKRKFE
jgi:5-methylcytosine-specific restriction endonuclease McrA